MITQLFDLERIRTEADLLAITGADTRLNPKGNGPHGKEYKGRCPFCGHLPGGADEDGFVVQPENNPPTWFCRKCTGLGNFTAIDYLARREKLDPHDHSDLEQIVGMITSSPAMLTSTPSHPAPVIRPMAVPPAQAWQESARAFIGWAQAQLWTAAGAEALAYLRNARGLNDRTIARFSLGYNPARLHRPAEKWGSPNDDPKPLTLWQGVVVPWIARGEVWAINIRQDHAANPKDRYKKVRGSRAGVFNADDLAGVESVLWCEGEMDTIRAWQEVNDVLAVASFGAAGNGVPDLATWGRYITGPSYHLGIYDNDEAGQKGLAKIAETIQRLRPVFIPGAYKDVSDYACAGGDLYRLIEPHLPSL